MKKKIDYGIMQGRDYVPGSQGEKFKLKKEEPNTMKPQHTPTPWYQTDEHIQSASVNQDNYVCKCDTKKDAEFIVQAVNAHEELVNALQDIREYFADCADADSVGDPLAFKPNKEMTILESIEKALAKAGVKV